MEVEKWNINQQSKTRLNPAQNKNLKNLDSAIRMKNKINKPEALGMEEQHRLVKVN